MDKHIIYLAAGNSRRFGPNKLLSLYGGKPLYQHGLDMLAAFCRKREDCSLTVVSQYQEILSHVQGRGIPAVYSPDSCKGMSYTIRAALCALGTVPEDDLLLFVVADQPYLTGDTLEKMLEHACPGTQTVSASYAGQPGNPTMFSARLIPELRALKGDEGGRKVIRRHACIYVDVADSRELYDIDTPEHQKNK